MTHLAAIPGAASPDPDPRMNQLYFGDNLQVLREDIRDETVDLIYLDPPFNSKRDYNLLFKSPKGQQSEAQITAFEDSWHWGEQAEREFDELLRQPNTDVAEMMRALRSFLGENDMLAYLTMMANRLSATSTNSSGGPCRSWTRSRFKARKREPTPASTA
jgi:hypothetical protein